MSISNLSPGQNQDWILDDSITPVHYHDQDFVCSLDEADPKVLTPGEATAKSRAEGGSGIKSLTDVEHESSGPKGVQRRHLLAGGLAATGLGALLAANPFTPRYAYAAGNPAHRVVVVFLRGGFDALTAFPAYGDPDYYGLRPTIGVRPEHLYQLNKTIGMHKALASLKPVWDAGQMAVVHATGFTGNSRSHFEAQDTVERAAPAANRSGWLGRHLASKSSEAGTFRAITFGSSAVASLSTSTGRADSIAMSSIDAFKINSPFMDESSIMDKIKSMYNGSGAEIQDQAIQTFKAVEGLRTVRSTTSPAANGAVYSSSGFGTGLREIARMSRANVGLEVACVDYGGWDHHTGQNSSSDTAALPWRMLKELGDNLANFKKDLGPEEWDRTTVVMMSEFGRRAAENGTGTDHGTGGVMVYLGGKVKGGVSGAWPGLGQAALTQGDLAISNDYRNHLSDLVSGPLGNSRIDAVFPGFTPTIMKVTK